MSSTEPSLTIDKTICFVIIRREKKTLFTYYRTLKLKEEMMKKKKIVWLFALMVFSSLLPISSANAEVVVEVNKSKGEKLAYAMPGKEFPTGIREKDKKDMERVDFFHYVPLAKKGATRSEQKKVAVWVILLLIAILLMIIGNILVMRSSDDMGFGGAIVASFFASVATALALATVLIAFSFAVSFATITAFFATFATFAIADGSKDAYKLLCASFYTSAIIALFVF